MRKTTLYFLTSIFLLFICDLTAQIEPILRVDDPTGLFKTNDTLYIGTYNFQLLRYVFDSGTDPQPLLDSHVFRFRKQGDELYISTGNSNIYKLNLKDGAIEEIYDQESPIGGIALYNDTLYFSEWYTCSLKKINLNQTPLEAEEVFTTLDNLNAMEVHNGTLYFLEDESGGVFKTDLNQGEYIIDTLFINQFDLPNELYTIDNYMYVSELDGNRIA